MDQEDLLNNERVEKDLSPHPLSFMSLQSLCIFLLVWGPVLGWLVNFSSVSEFFISNPFGLGHWIVLLVWGLVMLLVGVAASIVAIRWSIFFIYLAIFLGGVGLTYWQGWGIGEASVLIPFYTVGMSIIGFLMVEGYRRSHRYVITNHRIIFAGGVFSRRERSLRYDKITEIAADQGILGQIFGFGTINTVSASGFGLGADESFAAGGVEVGTEKKVGFMGLFGGGREVQTPRARTYYELHGVYPYKEVRRLIEGLVQGSVPTQYHQQQVDLQQQQLDIQQEMKNLLKMQKKEEPKKPKKQSIPPPTPMLKDEEEEEDEMPSWFPPDSRE